jgi:hypothetical protein
MRSPSKRTQCSSKHPCTFIEQGSKAQTDACADEKYRSGYDAESRHYSRQDSKSTKKLFAATASKASTEYYSYSA